MSEYCGMTAEQLNEVVDRLCKVQEYLPEEWPIEYVDALEIAIQLTTDKINEMKGGRRGVKMIKISGHSDDVIEIGGDWEDEIGSFDSETEITFSDGTVLLMQYSPDGSGAWRAKVLRAGSAKYVIEKLVNNDDYYSDLFTIDASGITGVKQKYVG